MGLVLPLLVAAVLPPVLVAGRIWYVGGQDTRPPSDAIIVLGAAQYDGDPSEVFEARLDHAAELYHQGVASRIITVGSAHEGDRYTEAGAARRWLVDRRGVPERAVVAVPRGEDTLTSLGAADDALERHGWSSAIVVTDPWHSLRSRTIARDLGIDVSTSPARDHNPVMEDSGVEVRYVGRETLAYIYYTMFHRSADVDLYSI